MSLKKKKKKKRIQPKQIVRGIDALNELSVITKTFYSIKWDFRQKIYCVRMLNKTFQSASLEEAMYKCVLYVGKAEGLLK